MSQAHARRSMAMRALSGVHDVFGALEAASLAPAHRAPCARSATASRVRGSLLAFLTVVKSCPGGGLALGDARAWGPGGLR